MTCRDTERLWNELLDARDEPREGLVAALEAHASACPACAATAARYRALRLALAAWPPATAPPGFAARVVHSIEVESEPGEALPFRRLAAIPRTAWLSAAAVLIASAIALRTIPPGKGRVDRLADAPTPPPTAEVLDLPDALADATAATLELALDASAPAGRLGRDMLASAALPTAAPPSPGVAGVPPADVLRSLGDRVEAGVRPLSGPARHAFGFLIPPIEGDAPAASPATPRSGA